MMSKEVENNSLDTAIAAIEKQFGKGAVATFTGKVEIPDLPLFSSGSLVLDRALGGGFVFGKIIEIYGPESSGKTTLALSTIAEAQKADKRSVYYIDMEHALDIAYAQKLGVNIKSQFAMSQPDSAEEALDILELVVRSGGASVVVIDSVAALVPRSELEGEMGAPQMGIQARLMSQCLRKVTAIAHKNNTAIIFINQIRMKIGVMFGNPETTTGGNALKFYATHRLDVRSGEKKKDEEQIVARVTNVKVIKNKIAPPFKEATFLIEFGKGINKTKDLIEIALATNIIEKSGAWYSYKGQKIGQGENNTIEFLEANPEIAMKIRGEIGTTSTIER